MLYKNYGFKKSKTKQYLKPSITQIKSSIKLDSFLNFSKISNDSISSINNTEIKIDQIVSKEKPKNKHSSLAKHKNGIPKKDKIHHKDQCCVGDLNKTLNKKKSDLSQYILSNTSTKNSFYYPNIKLLGNSRYKYTSPIMFVEDQKNNMSDNNLDLVPIPMERCKVEMTEKEENEREKKLYELQRSIVMLRRKQYNKASDIKKLRNQFIDYSSNSLKNEMDDISDYINKIVVIQKWWNNYGKKNEIEKNLVNLEKVLKNIVGKNTFKELRKDLIKYNKPLNKLCFIDKIRIKYIYEEPIKENLNENSLNSVELNETEVDKNINNLELNNNNINDINIDKENIKINNSEKNKKNEKFKYINQKENIEIENIENLENVLNNNEENNNIQIKNLEFNENNLESKNKDDNIEKIFLKLNSKNLNIFSNIIKKIFLSKFIEKIKLNDDLPAINKFITKMCFFSKERLRKAKTLIKKENKKIQRIQEINYFNNKIYKPQNHFSLVMNACFISKTRLGNKTILEQYKNLLKKKFDIKDNNLLKIVNTSNFFKINDNYTKINKNCSNRGLFISKISLKQDNNNIVKIQKFVKNKIDEKDKEDKTSIIYRQISKNPCLIDKVRKIDYIKLINIIQYIYKFHLNKNKKEEKIFKKNPNNNQSYYISKKRFAKSKLKENKHKKKLNYIVLLLNTFITKNIQEYIFQILNSGEKQNITNNKYYFPFYIKTLQRILNYIQKNDNPNKKISLFINEIFNHQNTKLSSNLESICFLKEKNKNKLINSNIFTGYEENDLINFLTDFSEFDKNINNELFIIERLKKIKLNNTNIFTLVKLLDNEYNNLVKGLYCFKCYNENNLCNCNKEKSVIKEGKSASSNDIEKSNDKSEDNLNIEDFDFSSENAENRKQIHYFDYYKDKKEDNDILIKTKIMNNENINQKLFDIILPENEINDKKK